MINQNLQETCYNDAVEICKSSSLPEKIQKARDIFADLGDYKDSVARLQKCDEFLAHQTGKKVIFGSYKGKPLSWTVIKTEALRCMLLADDVIDYVPFNEFRIGIGWNACDLRKWLNRTFMDQAFTFQEKLKIQITKLDNNFDPRWDNQNGLDTKDKLYVLCQNELDELLPSQEDRNIGKWWWLRGHGCSDLSQKAVYEDGSVYDSGVDVSATDVGVRPVLWIKNTL